MEKIVPMAEMNAHKSASKGSWDEKTSAQLKDNKKGPNVTD
jgi:hypothetical protein